MALTDPITLNDHSAVLKSFVLQNRGPGGSDYVESTATATDMRKIVIRHSNAGASIVKGSKPVRRHLIQFTDEEWNSTLGKTEKATVNVTITVDPGAAGISTLEIQDLVSFAKDFLSDTRLAQMIRDET